MRKLLTVLFAASAAACGASQSPSPHPHDLALGEEQSHVPNPEVTLLREYWVAISDGSTFFLFPRPDGAEAIAAECEAKGPLAPTFESARLCAPASSEADVKRINALSRDEAFTTSTFLHARLRFEARETQVAPHALTSDIVDVCSTNEPVRQGALKRVCDQELAWAEDGNRPDIALVYSAEEAAALAEALNALYGIAPAE